MLHRFTSDEGFRPTAGVAIGKDGDLYGTTLFGPFDDLFPRRLWFRFKVEPNKPREIGRDR